MSTLVLAIMALSMGMCGGMVASFVLWQKHERQFLEFMKNSFKVMEVITANNKQNRSNIECLTHRISRIECLIKLRDEQPDD